MPVALIDSAAMLRPKCKIGRSGVRGRFGIR